MSSLPVTQRAAVDPPRGPGRVLLGLDRPGSSTGLEDHLRRWGPPPLHAARDLVEAVGASGLRGHGGAWFPVADKWRSVAASRRRPVVVANAAEGEPASAKDAFLLAHAPDLVLDGASLAASALRADRVVVYCPRTLARHVARAVADRRRAGFDPVEPEVVTAPAAFVAGQETAVVNALNGRGPTPTFAGLQPVRVRGVDGRPTLVQNAETLAHVALVARFGPQWFRELGTEGSPGTMLLTVTGRWSEPTVVEAALGTPLRTVLDLGDRDAENVQGVLLGGYGGAWIRPGEALGMPLTEEAARESQATLGPGVVVVLPRGVCALQEVSRVVRYMAGQSAGQCGPCVNGLGELSLALDTLASGPARRERRPHRQPPRAETLLQLCDLVEGRGACRHPDGVASFVRSALRVFGDEIAAHRRGGSCVADRGASILPTPTPTGGRVR